MEDGEPPEISLQRELHEELGMRVIIWEHFVANLHAYPKLKIELMAFKCDFVSATFEMTNHDAIAWGLPKQLLKYDMAAVDIPVVQSLARLDVQSF